MAGYLIKGDISGIQNFIFNVPTKGAAKQLKARSFFVQALCNICVEKLRSEFSCELIYNGGGNFIQKTESFNETRFAEIAKQLSRELLPYDLLLYLTFVEETGSYVSSLKNLHQKANEDKIKKNALKNLYEDVFTVSEKIATDNFKELAKELSECKGFDFSTSTKNFSGIGNRSQDLVFLNTQLHFSKSTANLQTSVVNKFPIWHDKLKEEFLDAISDVELKKLARNDESTDLEGIIEFEHLAAFAKHRTGTAKLGVLKLDLDNLGNLMSDIRHSKHHKDFSEKLRIFFEEEILNLLRSPYDKFTYFDNIYVVFSGGDDCFLLGAWDAVLDFSILLQEKFSEYVKTEALNSFLGKKQDNIHFSAAFLLFDAHFPIVQMSEKAEEEMKNAKTWRASRNEVKNCFSVFGKPVGWEQINEIRNIKNDLLTIIEKTGKRAIVSKTLMLAADYENLYDNALEGKLQYPRVWRFSYVMRDGIVKDKIERGFLDGIVSKYEIWLLEAAEQKNEKQIDKMKISKSFFFPVAARWVEFLTRKQIKHGK